MNLNIKAYAKINLILRVLEKLKSGYHKIETVMQRVDLYDNMGFELMEDDNVIISCNNAELIDEENLAYKAAQLLKKKYGIDTGIKIAIEKNIPISSGLGGGSSNAASTLFALNKLWKLKLGDKKLVELGSQIGSDVPFFVSGDSAFVSGTGDKIKLIKKPYKMNVILINPGFRMPTKNVYKMLDKVKKSKAKKPSALNMVKAMEKNDMHSIASNVYNDFEEVLFKKHAVLKDIKVNLIKNRALNATISGSGPTVFGIFDSIYTAREAYYELKDSYPFIFLTKTI